MTQDTTTEAPASSAPADVVMQEVKTDAMLPGAETQEIIKIPVGNGPANTRIIQAVMPTPVATDQKPSGAAEVQEAMDKDTAKGYTGWRPGDPL